MRGVRACNGIASSNKKKSNIHSLPEEIIIYILILLPADVLYNSARFVCRKWFNIVDTPMFVAEHLLHYRSAFLSQPFSFEPACLAEFGESNANVAQTSLPFESEVCASCDGLAVVRVEGKFYVANLLTKQTIALPWVNYHLHRPRRRSMSLIRGSGMDDYRAVFSYLSGDDRNLQCIYITVGKDRAWRPISCGDLSDLYRARTEAEVKTIGVGGIVYWVLYTRSPIFALGNDMETFHQLSNPILNYDRVGQCAYVGGRNTLSLVVSYKKELVLDVWFVCGSGSCFEWRKEKRIDLRARSPELTWPSYMDPLYGLAWVHNDEALVLKDGIGCFVYHNVKTGKTFKFGRETIGCRGYFADFTYSLARPTCS